MCLLHLDPPSARRFSSWVVCLLIACLALSVAIPSIADHLHLTHAVNTLDFVRGFLIGLSITLLATGALLARRARSGPASTNR